MLQVRENTGKRIPKAQGPIEWDDLLKAWCVTDATLIDAAFKSADLVAVDYAGEYRKLESRGLEFPAIIDVLERMPLANEGERHAELRKQFARLMSTNVSPSRLRKALRKEVKERVEKVFTPGVTLDLIPQMLRPICDMAFTEMLGVSLPADSGSPSVSQLFDRTLGLNRRMLIEGKIAHLSSAVSSCPYQEPSADLRAVLLIVGYDSLLGSLGCSLLHVLQHADNHPLNCLTYPEDLPETGVPYIERIAARDCQLGGVPLPRGSRVRLLLDAAEEQLTDRSLYFGAGRHLCLGKALSKFLWQSLVEDLSTLAVHVRIDSARRRPRDYVFKFYESLVVTVHD